MCFPASLQYRILLSCLVLWENGGFSAALKSLETFEAKIFGLSWGKPHFENEQQGKNTIQEVKISSWYRPSALLCEILFGRSKVTKEVRLQTIQSTIFCFNFQTQRVLSDKGNLELRTWPGLLFHQHYPPKNTNINVN